MPKQSTPQTEPSPDRQLPAKVRWPIGIALALAALAIALHAGPYFQKHVTREWIWFWLPIGSIALLVAGWIADRLRRPIAGMVVTALIATTALTAGYYHHYKPLKRLFDQNRVHLWNQFHYVIGTKYFDELGYYDLYAGALLADIDGKNWFEAVTRARDLRTYKHVPKEQEIARAQRENLRGRFTDERWDEFKADLYSLQKQRGKRAWNGPLKDRGYNPSPAFLIFAKPLLERVNLQRRATLAALAKLDIWVYVLTVLVGIWAFGARRTAVGWLWLMAWIGNQGPMVGGFLHYDWLFLVVGGVALYKKKHPAPAAVLIGYGAMMRGFPGLFAIHPGLMWLKALAQRRWPERRHTVFLAVLGVTCIACVAVSSAMTSRGFGAWTDWRDKIAVHAEHHPFSQPRIGLSKLFTHDWGSGNWHLSLRQVRVIWERNQTAYNAARAVLIALTLASMLRRKDRNGMLLAMAVIFYGMTTSRYYASIWALLFTWMAFDRREIVNLLLACSQFGLISYFVHYLPRGMHRGEKSYTLFDVGMAIYFLVVVLIFLVRDGRWLVAWLRERRTGSGASRAKAIGDAA